MHNRTDLASGPINGSDRLTVHLLRTADTPAFIAVDWPSAATIATPRRGRGHHQAYRPVRYQPGRPQGQQKALSLSRRAAW